MSWGDRSDTKSLLRVAGSWERLGSEDPFWAILAAPGTRGGNWDIERFYKSGSREVGRIMEVAASLPVSFDRGSALDFGCGAGRLTQALCEHFETCTGVDVANSMIQLANENNRHGDRCRYIWNYSNDLRILGERTFDFICTLIVLQHMPAELSAGYLSEFLRLLSDRGLLVFQLPAELRPQFAAPGRTCDPGPLPISGFVAGLQTSAGPLRAQTSAPLIVHVVVTNNSDSVWPARGDDRGWYQVKLANHWLMPDGGILTLDDGRSDLPRDLSPGKRESVALTVCAPTEPGEYVLELDLVQEMVAWFGDHGSQTLEVPVSVYPATGEQQDDAGGGDRQSALADLESTIEMHGIPLAKVCHLIHDQDCRVVRVEEDGFAGPEWVSYRYYVVRNSNNPNASESTSAW
jgi:SAM-dependent methyltransferase